MHKLWCPTGTLSRDAHHASFAYPDAKDEEVGIHYPRLITGHIYHTTVVAGHVLPGASVRVLRCLDPGPDGVKDSGL